MESRLYIREAETRSGTLYERALRERRVLRRTFYLLPAKLLLRASVSTDCAKWDVKSFSLVLNFLRRAAYPWP